MQAVIFANGELVPDCVQLPQEGEVLILAADGGSRHCQKLAILPDVLIGDLDSITPFLLDNWKAQGVKTIRHSRRKDQTDLELALRYAQEQGAKRIMVYGALGARLDMTLANFFLLAHPDLNAPIEMISLNQRVMVVRAGQQLQIHGQPGDTLSLLPLLPETAGITSQGLEYALKDESLQYGRTRGISNQLLTETAEIKLEEGILGVVHTRKPCQEERSL